MSDKIIHGNSIMAMRRHTVSAPKMHQATSRAGSAK